MMRIAIFFYVLALLTNIIIFSDFAAAADSTKVEDKLLEEENSYWKQVFDKYLDAIGGKELFAAVQDRTTIMKGLAMEQAIEITVKQKAPNLFYQQMHVGSLIQKTIFDGKNAVMFAQDQVIKIEKKDLEKLKVEADIHFLLHPDSLLAKITYEGTELIDSIYSHKLKLVLPSGIRWFQYYDAETGLKIKEVKEVQTSRGLLEQNILYSNYTEVDGLKFPFTIKQTLGMQAIELNVTDIQINTGLDEEVFRIPE